MHCCKPGLTDYILCRGGGGSTSWFVVSLVMVYIAMSVSLCELLKHFPRNKNLWISGWRIFPGRLEFQPSSPPSYFSTVTSAWQKKIEYFYFYLISVLYLTGPISPCCRLRLIMVLLTQSIFEVFLQRRKTGIHLAPRLTGSGEVKISL